MNQTNKGHNESIFQLVKNLAVDSASLVRTEVDLIRDEVNDKLTISQRGTKTMAAGGVVLFFATGAAIATLIIALAYVMDLWLAAVLVTVALGVLGGVLVAKGRRTLSAENLKPKESIETLKENRDFAKEKWNERKYG